MIQLADVRKEYPTRRGPVRVLDGVDLTIRPGERIGIIGPNGVGKSTLIRIVSGAERPDSGTVVRDMSVSWPIALAGGFQGTLTGIDNVRFICRIYGVDPAAKLGFVEDFAEIGRYMGEPLKTYSSGMRARLAFAISMAIDFDCFLIDEVVAVGDDRFRQKCEKELFEKRRDSAMIIISHSRNFIRQHCKRVALLTGGKLIFFDDVEEAYRTYASESFAIAS
jgi:capsular polysaccharide transport system ATP-binding protein